MVIDYLESIVSPSFDRRNTFPILAPSLSLDQQMRFLRQLGLTGFTLFLAVVLLQCKTGSSQVTTLAPVPAPTNGTLTPSPLKLNSTNVTNSTTSKPKANPRVKPTWQTWVTLAAVLCLLIALSIDLAPCPAVMFFTTLVLRLIGIITTDDFLHGLSNAGVITIAFLYVIVEPLTELPLIRKLLALTMRGTGVYLPNLKLAALMMCLSWCMNNTPLVAMMTPLVRQYCVDNNLSPSQYLMSMNVGTLLGGTFAVIGTSTNLVYDGLMRSGGLGPMPFFEPIKISGIPALIILPYLVFLPALLLPKHPPDRIPKKSEKGDRFIVELVVTDHSPLNGVEVASMNSFVPYTLHPHFALTGIKRKGSTLTLEEAIRFESEDGLLLFGTIGALRTVAAICNLEWLPINRSQVVLNGSMLLTAMGEVPRITPTAKVRSEQAQTESTAAGVEGSNNTVPVEHGEAATAEPSSNEPIPEPSSTKCKDAKTPLNHTNDFFESFESRETLALGTAVMDRVFEQMYGVTIIAAVPAGVSQKDLTLDTSVTPTHVLGVGDRLLVHGWTTRLDRNYDHFLLHELSSHEVYNAVLAQHYRPMPSWLPLGAYMASDKKLYESKETPAISPSSPVYNRLREPMEPKPEHGHRATKPTFVGSKLVRLPDWYQYLTALIFAAMMACAIGGIDIILCAAVACVVIVMIKLQTLRQAFDAIEIDIMVMVAFSFGLGTAMDKSKLAALIGQTINDANIQGFPLLILIASVACVVTNVITNKACAQVLFPVVLAIYRQQGRDPMSGVMLLVVQTSCALFTPYGFATSLIIMGPGKYTALDYIKFGLPLNIVLIVLFSVDAAIVYNDW
jgi:di/tricarboxylate transporter